MRKEPVEIRFWKYVKKTEKCWIWTGAIYKGKNQGYGKIMTGYGVDRRPQRAHRVSYEMHKGKIKDNLCVLHSCDNPPCVNPEHLSLGTKKDNNADMIKKGRGKWFIGDKHHRNKVKAKEVKNIVKLYSTGKIFQKDIAKIYGVNQATISRLIRFGKNI